jgi:hypothetical protein
LPQALTANLQAPSPPHARFPRLAGARGPAGSDLHPNFAGLRTCPATACGACPGFMKTRYFGSTVRPTDASTPLRGARLATRRARALATNAPLAESKRGRGSVPGRPVARTRGHGKAGTSDRSATATDADDAARLAAGEIQVRHPAWARDLPLCERSAHRGHSRARCRCLCVTQSRAAHAPRRSLEK